ncbi:MAG: YbhB/YbcL family Raf kinase inhibitor-like protein [Thermodesulfobacteriota bacterium]
MKNIILLTAAAGILILLAGNGSAQDFVLSSKEMKKQLTEDQVYSGFGCTGKNISPSLSWAGAPTETKSFAITVFDPDARKGRGWWHWLIFNIPAGIQELSADAGNMEKNLVPEGCVQSVTDFGKPGFGGACPPIGEIPHRYIFTVYALAVEKLDLNENASPRKVESALEKHALSRAALMSYYGR